MAWKIIAYSDLYAESVKDLLVELQGYIAEIDKERYNILTADFWESYFAKTVDAVKQQAGQIFLAIEEEKVVGCIAGVVQQAEETYDFCAPKRGRVTELVMSAKYRAEGIGKALLDRMESCFKEAGCQGVLIDVFAYNTNAQAFYAKNGYSGRSIEMMKKI